MRSPPLLRDCSHYQHTTVGPQRGLRLLAAGDVQSPLQPGFRLLCGGPVCRRSKTPRSERFPLPSSVPHAARSGCGPRPAPGGRLPCGPGWAQTSASTVYKYGTNRVCPRGPQGGDPLVDLGQPHLPLALHGQRPPRRSPSLGPHEWQALLGRECDGGLGLLVHGRHVPAQLREEGRPTPRTRQTKGTRQRVCQRQGLVEVGQGLLRVPQ